MKSFVQIFDSRQYMLTNSFEFFHYKDESLLDISFHNHDFFEVFYYISGKSSYIVEGKTYNLKKGDIIIINNKEIHRTTPELGEVYERFVVWIHPDYLIKQGSRDTNLAACFENSSREKSNLIRPPKEIRDMIYLLLRKIENEMNNKEFGNDILKDIYITELMVHINRAYLESTDEDIEDDIVYDEKINLIIEYINANLSEELSLDYLSEKFYISKYHLLREFKKYTGYTIHQYIRKKRLLMAKSLIKSGTKVSDVCFRCGFADYSNFIRVFKNEFGFPPRAYYRFSEGDSQSLST